MLDSKTSCSPFHTHTSPCHLSNTWWNIHASSWQLSAMMLMKAQTVAPARAIYSRLDSTAFGKLRNTLMTLGLFQASSTHLPPGRPKCADGVPGLQLCRRGGGGTKAMPHCGCNVFFSGSSVNSGSTMNYTIAKAKGSSRNQQHAPQADVLDPSKKLVHKQYSTKLDKPKLVA